MNNMNSNNCMNWYNTLSSLSYDNNKRNKCHIRLLDTVFIDNDTKQPHWYYTTKSGIYNNLNFSSIN